MTIQTVSQVFNPITGVFGTGQVQVYGYGGSASWNVPAGIGKVRVRLWGGGASVGGGGGFALKTINDLSGVTSIAVAVGGVGGTSSFGSYVSATGGTTTSGSYNGIGLNGDINYAGGNVSGGGAANLFGNGGTTTTPSSSGAIGGYHGLFLAGATAGATATPTVIAPASMASGFSIDFLGTGGSGSSAISACPYGINGGGGVYGGYPGGGGTTAGAPGMVIVEW